MTPLLDEVSLLLLPSASSVMLLPLVLAVGCDSVTFVIRVTGCCDGAACFISVSGLRGESDETVSTECSSVMVCGDGVVCGVSFVIQESETLSLTVDDVVVLAVVVGTGVG